MAKLPKIEQPQVAEPQLSKQAKKLKRDEFEKQKISEQEKLRREANDAYNTKYEYRTTKEGKPQVETGEYQGESGEAVKLESFGYTKGHHDINQDAGVLDPENGLIAVCDGAGGHFGAEAASRKSAEIINKEMRAIKFKKLENTKELTDAKISYKQALAQVIKKTRTEVRRGKSTAVIGKVLGEMNGELQIAVSWTGDSSAFLIREDGTAQRITEEHNVYEELRAGKLNPETEAFGAVPYLDVYEIGGPEAIAEALKQMIEKECDTVFDLKRINIDDIYENLDPKIEVKKKMKFKDLRKILKIMQRKITKCIGCSEIGFDTQYINLKKGEKLVLVSDAYGDNISTQEMGKRLKGGFDEVEKFSTELTDRIEQGEENVKRDDASIFAFAA